MPPQFEGPPQNFKTASVQYSWLESHRELAIAAGAVIFFGIVVSLIMYYVHHGVPGATSSHYLTTAEKEEIIRQLSAQNQNTVPLSPAQKSAVIKDLAKNAPSQPPMTAEEKASIINSLSK